MQHSQCFPNDCQYPKIENRAVYSDVLSPSESGAKNIVSMGVKGCGNGRARSAKIGNRSDDAEMWLIQVALWQEEGKVTPTKDKIATFPPKAASA